MSPPTTPNADNPEQLHATILDAAATTTDDGGDSYADALPVPPRYWWLKRISIAAAVLLVALIGVRLWWGWDADRQLQREIDRIVAAGEPIYPEDFDPKESIPNAENAALILIDAAAQLLLPKGDRTLVDYIVDNTDAIAANAAEITRIAETNKSAMTLARSARNLTKADWGVRMRTPMLSILLPNLAGQRDLGKLIAATTFLRLEEGNSREAFALLEDAIAQARTMDAHPTLIGHLVATAQYALAWKTVEVIPLRLEIENETTSPDQNAVTRSQISDLIVRLQDEGEFQSALVRAIQTERALMIDSICAVADGRVSLPMVMGGGPTPSPFFALIPTVALRPVMITDARVSLSRLSRTVFAGSQPTWPQAVSMLPKENELARSFVDWLHISRVLEPSFERAIQLHYRCVAMRRMTRLALTIRLYEVDHGRRPAELDNLVPEYLPALPVDPFGDGEQTFGYLPDALWPRLYSVGSNGVDDEGEVAFRSEDHIDYDIADVPFFLTGRRPKDKTELASPPSNNRANDDR